MPIKASLAISGCAGGGGGGGGYDDGASAGAGGGGGGSGLCIQNLIVIAPAGEVMEITIGGGGGGGVAGANGSLGGSTSIKFTKLKPGDFSLWTGGLSGGGALGLAPGGFGYAGTTGGTGFGAGGNGSSNYPYDYPPLIAAGGVTSGAVGTVNSLLLPPYAQLASGGGAGGNPGADGGGASGHCGFGIRAPAGGLAQDGAGGGGAGGASMFGARPDGGYGHVTGYALTWGYGAGGGGGGGNSAGGANAGGGANGLPGYLQIIYMQAQ